MQMLRSFAAASVALCATGTLAGTFPSPPLYPSFSSVNARIIAFDPPGSTLTVTVGINADSKVYGYYFDSASVRHSFIRNIAGAFNTFEAPNAGTGAEHGTTATAVNAAGDITGYYTVDSNDTDHAFMRVGTAFMEFNPPKAFITTPTGINSSDTVTGWFFAKNEVERSFLRKPNGNITVFEAPGAFVSGGTGTTAECIDDGGVIAGEFEDKHSAFHGFVRGVHGKFTTFDPPKSISTVVKAINTAGAVVGYFLTADKVAHGYVRSADGSIETFDIPGAGTSQFNGTYANAINDAGDIAGYIVNGRGVSRAYLRMANGKVTKFSVAVAAHNGPGSGTQATGINASDAVAGVYYDKKQVPHGFLRTLK